MRIAALLLVAAGAARAAIGIFDTSDDVGAVELSGSAQHANGVYRISASGINMWGASDAFHFLHAKRQGDVSLTADIAWATPGGNPHKKGGPILRAGLDANAPYADLIAHGDGTLSLQYRLTPGGPTAEVKTALKAPARLRLERHGDVISAEAAPAGGPFQPIGALVIPLPETVYAGLAVTAHDPKTLETAVFTNVEMTGAGVIQEKQRVVESTLEVVEAASGLRRIVHRARTHFEAPNWSRDGFLYFNGGGSLFRIPAAGGVPEKLASGNLRLNNDHGISPDGKWMAVSGAVPGSGGSQIYLLPIAGGEPKPVMETRPSYWHGWSPDGKTLVYCAQRNGNYDIYAVPAQGGEETRLTTADGLDDGPEYSPDGQWIYFNSERTGVMQLWRMRPDGSGQERVSRGPLNADWFAHPSPDGRQIVYLAFDASVKGHPPNKDVSLRIMPADGSADPKVLVKLFGGQGTINVPSWSPDSRYVAFVSYRLLAP